MLEDELRRSGGIAATALDAGARGVTRYTVRSESHSRWKRSDVQNVSRASGKVDPNPSTLRVPSSSAGRRPE